jgi:L-idonate 5-dehydrogenase
VKDPPTALAKELQLRGSFRFHEEFGIAVDHIDKGVIDVRPLILAILPFTQARDAFELANDRSKSMNCNSRSRDIEAMCATRTTSTPSDCQLT